MINKKKNSILIRQIITLLLIITSNALCSRTTIKVYHLFEQVGSPTQKLKNSIIINFNDQGLMSDSTIYSHTTPLNRKYVYVSGDDGGLKLKHTYKKEMILSYLFNYNKTGKKISTTLIGSDNKVLWKEFLKYDSNENLVKKLKYDPSQATNPEMMVNPENTYEMTWAEIYKYDSSGAILERKELYNNYILSVTTFDIDSSKIAKKKSEYFDPSIIFQTTYFHNFKNQINHEISVDRFGKSLGSKMFEYDFMDRIIKSKIYNESGLIKHTLDIIYDDDNLKRLYYYSDSLLTRMPIKEVILNELHNKYIVIKLEGNEKVLEKEVYYYDKKNRISRIKIYDMVRKQKDNSDEIPIMLHTYEYD